jgi:ketosteroid isomerase-like protein
MNGMEVIEAFSEALAKGDIPTAFSFFASDAKWHQPGENKYSGLKNNPDEIGAMLGAMMKDTGGTLVVSPNGALMESGDMVATPVRFTASKGVAKIDMTGIDIYEVKGGKITRVWLFSQDQKIEDNFWGR